MYWGGLSAAANAAAAYQTSQTGYATVGHTPAAATYATQRAATGTTYDAASYQTAAAAAAAVAHTTGAATYPTAVVSTAYDYGYGRTTQTAAAAAAAAAAYDTTKTYYAQPSTATAYTAADTHYQTAAKSYSTPAAYTVASRQAPAAVPPKTTYASAYSGATSVGVSTSYNPSYSTPSVAGTVNKTVSQQQKPAATWQHFKKAGTMGQKTVKPKPPPKPQQLHYCDVCKISCAGPQTYREHLEGQKHKKKEAAGKVGPAPSRHGASLRCELCDVTCTGNDAYAAHIRGAKHQKVVKLHQKLGKPIPSTDPVVVGTATKAATSPTTGGTSTGTSKTSTTTSTTSQGSTSESKKEELSKEEQLLDLKEKDVEPVGQEYIEEIKNEEGKVVSFNCKLCECRFNDPNAKEMHMKGRRHRLQYKKKVNPELQVDLKPSLRQRKVQEEKLRRQQVREELWRRREDERLMVLEEEERWYWEERRRYEEEREYFEYMRGGYPRGPPNMGPPMMPPHGLGPGAPRPPFVPGMPPMMPIRRPDSSDDRHVLSKHAEIYPKEEELASIQKIVSNTEKALKMVSDYLAQIDAPKETKAIKKEKGAEKAEDKKISDKKEKDDGLPRTLKGVMRVGILAKGLLLKGDAKVQLVVLCAEKPTRSLLDRVADNLPKQLKSISAEEKYDIQRVVEEASLVVRLEGAATQVAVSVTFTSPIMREPIAADGESQAPVVKDPPDVLDKQKCLEALAALRHAKWFQARANGMQSCVMVIRILRDLSSRVPTWTPISHWPMELMVEKVIASAGQPLSPGDSLRRIFEALSSGLLLPGSPGLLDPCEKDPIDATHMLSPQEREDITSSAQHALRLISYRQIHKVLGMDFIPPPKFGKGQRQMARFARKRRRDQSAGEGNDSDAEEGGEGKKDKRDVSEPKMETEKTK